MSRLEYRDGHGPATVAVVERPTRAQPPRWKYSWIWAGIWLAYLSQPFVAAWHEPDAVQRWTALAAISLFAVTFVVAFAVLPRLQRSLVDRRPIEGSWMSSRRLIGIGIAVTAFMAALAVVITALLGEAQLPIFVFVAVMAMFLLPGAWGPGTVLAIIAGTALAQWLVPQWAPDLSVQFQIFVAGLAMWGVVQIIRRNRELDAAHQEIARLAVEEERNRFARDLHDILGHSLTVVAVKAELAGRLVRLDPDRAEHEITEVERLSREALAEVRTAVAGYREVTLSGELANARTALSAAGIDADLPAAIDDIPAERRELFGWVVREGITNVVRHSGASRCRVRIGPSEVSITDDGASLENVAGETMAGHGLVGLRERAEAMGGALLVGRSAEGGFALTVRV
jgi:two-component system sensor histidine kinase DesK